MKWDGNMKMDAREIDCEDRIRIELAQGRVQWRVLVLTLLKLQSLLPVSWSDCREMGCEDRRWTERKQNRVLMGTFILVVLEPRGSAISDSDRSQTNRLVLFRETVGLIS
jgi:hypothetical protein